MRIWFGILLWQISLATGVKYGRVSEFTQQATVQNNARVFRSSAHEKNSSILSEMFALFSFSRFVRSAAHDGHGG